MAQFYIQPYGTNHAALAVIRRRGRGNTWPVVTSCLVGDMELVQHVLKSIGHDCHINDDAEFLRAKGIHVPTIEELSKNE